MLHASRDVRRLLLWGIEGRIAPDGKSMADLPMCSIANLREFGAAYNTLAAACRVDGEIIVGYSRGRANAEQS